MVPYNLVRATDVSLMIFSCGVAHSASEPCALHQAVYPTSHVSYFMSDVTMVASLLCIQQCCRITRENASEGIRLRGNLDNRIKLRANRTIRHNLLHSGPRLSVHYFRCLPSFGAPLRLLCALPLSQLNQILTVRIARGSLGSLQVPAIFGGMTAQAFGRFPLQPLGPNTWQAFLMVALGDCCTPGGEFGGILQLAGFNSPEGPNSVFDVFTPNWGGASSTIFFFSDAQSCMFAHVADARCTGVPVGMHSCTCCGAVRGKLHCAAPRVVVGARRACVSTANCQGIRPKIA